MSTAENGSETGEDLKAQVEALRVEVARLQNAQRRAIR